MNGLDGKRIVEVRPMTNKELALEGWTSGTSVLVLDDGTKLYASQDSEGNGPGALFGTAPNGSQFGLA